MMLCMICDDQKSELETVQKLVAGYAEAHPDLLLSVRCFSSPFDMLDEIDRSGAPDIALLDICMPGVLGAEVAREIQRKSQDVTDIVFLTNSPDFAVEAFALHVDDYLTKPFNILELKARVRALLRRAGAAQQQRSGNELAAGHIILNTGERTASRDGVSVELTAKEFDLMELLMRNPGRVYSRENLLNVVWGYEYIGDFRTVDVHIRRLREKLELDPANPEYIRTKWGVGYYLSARGPRRLENV